MKFELKAEVIEQIPNLFDVKAAYSDAATQLLQGHKPSEQSLECEAPLYVSAESWQNAKCLMLDKIAKHKAGGKDDPYKSSFTWERGQMPRLEINADWLAGGRFDSPFWKLNTGLELFTFDQHAPDVGGQTMLGSEANYYFVGMWQAAYGRPLEAVIGVTFLWKWLNYFQGPSVNAIRMANLGYANYARDLKECQDRHRK